MTEESAASGWQMDRGALVQVLVLCVMAFLLMSTYAIARPASEALFLSAYGSKSLPYVWLAVALSVVLVVGWYNRVVAQLPLLRMFVWALLVTGGLLGSLLGAQLSGVPGATFALYVWKDVYIVVLVELYWSFANSIFPIRTAKWAYGLFCVMGSLGGIVGNLGVGWAAAHVGTLHTLWLIFPIFVVLGVVCLAFARLSGDVIPERATKADIDLWAGIEVLRKSAYLIYLLFLIGVVQVAITLIDYQYNNMLEVTYTTTEQRTAIIGQVYALIDLASIVLQLMTGVILQFVGVPLTLLGIPFLLALSIGGFMLWPGFAALALAKVISKSTNYSIFKAAKEILYIPLNYREKTQGKAVVDILSYRFAKGVASLVLLLLLTFQLQGPGSLAGVNDLLRRSLKQLVGLNNSIFVSLFSLALILVWLWLTLLIVRRYRERVSVEDEEAV